MNDATKVLRSSLSVEHILDPANLTWPPLVLEYNQAVFIDFPVHALTYTS